MNHLHDDDALSLGRTSRGNNRPLDRIVLVIPLTADGEIGDDAFTAALATIFTYHPNALDPNHIRSIMVDVLRRIHGNTGPRTRPRRAG